MVYTGQPSKACGLCRYRKIKCDEKRPECSQCARLKTKCPGYRNPLDLKFRDQGRDLQRKFNIGKSTAESSDSVPHTSTAERAPASDGSSLGTFRISPSMESLVTPFFFSYFFADDAVTGQLLLPCLPRTMNNAEQDDCLAMAIGSVGHAVLSNIQNSPEHILEARRKYGQAVRLTSSALRNPKSCNTYHMVMTVMLLAMFEVITCHDPNSLRAWSNHLEGAAALLNLQGASLMKDRSGVNLFLQLRSQILINALQRNAPVPTTIAKWARRLKKLMTQDELIYTQLSDIMDRYANCRAAILNIDYLNAHTTVSALIAIDEDLEKWAALLPSFWRYERHTTAPSEWFYGQAYHTYPSYSIALSWHDYRVVRCIVNDMLFAHFNFKLLSCGGHASPSILQERDRVMRRTQALCDEICCSVPYFLGRINHKYQTKPTVGGLQVMWGCFVCACMLCVPATQRLWALKQLEAIGHSMGVAQAVQMSNVMKKKVEGNAGEKSAWDTGIMTKTWFEDMRIELDRRVKEGFNPDFTSRIAATWHTKSID